MTAQLRSTLTQVRKEKTRADNLLNVVIPLGLQLSSEKDFNLLLERTVVEAKAFCHASGGELYLRSDGNLLKPVIVRNEEREVALGVAAGNPVEREAVALAGTDDGRETLSIPARVALTGLTVNLDFENEEVAPEYELALEMSESGERPHSVLAIPLKNTDGDVLGVLELLNAKDPESGRPAAFDANLQQMMESYSSLAVAALEAYIREQSLRQEIQQLRIEIDEANRQQQVSEIVDSDFFQDLQVRARSIARTQAPVSVARLARRLLVLVDEFDVNVALLQSQHVLGARIRDHGGLELLEPDSKDVAAAQSSCRFET